MPKSDIDYSNIVFYKIVCKEPTIKDVFISYTTHFTQRKHLHKAQSLETNGNKDKLLYDCIQKNGGWENWEMMEIKKGKCKNSLDAKKKELALIKLYKATLNVGSFSKIIYPFYCETCNYHCTKKTMYEKHLLSKKHGNQEESYLKCQYCNKKYKGRSGLWYHEKKCEGTTSEQDTYNEEVCLDKTSTKSLTSELIMDIVKQNKEFKDLLVEQNKQNLEQNQEFKDIIMEQNKKIIELSKKTLTMATSRATVAACSQQHINSHNTINNRFNLNVFLNETCKDALNISDFINSLQISMDDVEQVGACGFVEGISKIFVKGLKELDVCKRPIHCSDVKRETMHVKENNVWEKDDENRHKLIEAIKNIADKNIKTIPEWKQENPECRDSHSKKSDQYLQIVGQSLGACDKTKDNENYQKIIKKVAKEVVIDKQARGE